MNGFKFATVPIAKLLTMPSSASKMPGTGSQIGLGKPCVCSRRNAASSGMLQRLANGRRLRKEYRKYERYSRKHFGVSADPLPFVEGTGYQALFKISCSPSFHTERLFSRRN